MRSISTQIHSQGSGGQKSTTSCARSCSPNVRPTTDAVHDLCVIPGEGRDVRICLQENAFHGAVPEALTCRPGDSAEKVDQVLALIPLRLSWLSNCLLCNKTDISSATGRIDFARKKRFRKIFDSPIIWKINTTQDLNKESI